MGVPYFPLLTKNEAKSYIMIPLLGNPLLSPTYNENKSKSYISDSPTWESPTFPTYNENKALNTFTILLKYFTKFDTLLGKICHCEYSTIVKIKIK